MVTKKTTKAQLTVETLKHDEAPRQNIPTVESPIIPKPENLAALVLAIRGEKVLLDADLADLYGVATKVLNQAVKRNLDRFPVDFMFQLTPEEWEGMRSQIVTSYPGNNPMKSQTVTASRRKLTAITTVHRTRFALKPTGCWGQRWLM